MVRVVRATSGKRDSWNEKFWCARTSDEEKEEECVNVFMNDVRVVRGRVRVIRGGEKVYAVCDAGVKVRDVLEYIAERGYALKSIPWFIDQTVEVRSRRAPMDRRWCLDRYLPKLLDCERCFITEP